MIRTSFSTVACHDWTLDRVARAGAEWGYDGVELRTFGSGATEFACDPFLTGTDKIVALLGEAGLRPACLATSIRFDEAIDPPAIGRVITDTERSVRAAKSALDLAGAIGCPLVRVFGFELPDGEKRSRGLARIVARLAMALDHARNTGVRLVIENGGSFPTAADLAEIMDATNHSSLGASYSMSVAAAAGEDPIGGINVLAERLWAAKVKDLRDGKPCPLGTGDLPCERFVRGLAGSGLEASLVYEWDRAWLTGLAEPEEILPGAARRLFEWIGQEGAGVPGRAGRGYARA